MDEANDKWFFIDCNNDLMEVNRKLLETKFRLMKLLKELPANEMELIIVAHKRLVSIEEARRALLEAARA